MRVKYLLSSSENSESVYPSESRTALDASDQRAYVPGKFDTSAKYLVSLLVYENRNEYASYETEAETIPTDSGRMIFIVI